MKRAGVDALDHPLPLEEESSSVPSVLLACVSLALAVVAGYLVVLDPGWLQVDFSPSRPGHLLALLAAGAGTVIVFKWPQAGLVFLIALVYSNGSEVAVRQFGWPSLLQLLTALLLMGILARSIARGERLVGEKLLLPLALYAAVVFASSLVALDPHLADAQLVEVLKGIFLFAVILQLTRSTGALRAAVRTMLAVGAVLATVSAYQVLTSSYGQDFGGFGRIKIAHIVGDLWQPRIAGPLSDPNFYAQILVPLVPMALYRLREEISFRLRLLAAYSLAAVLAALVFTYSRGGVLALAFLLFLIVILHRVQTRYVLAGLGILLALFLLGPRGFEQRVETLSELLGAEEESVVADLDTSFQERALLMQVAWQEFRDHPALGVGAGNYSEHYDDYARQIGSTIESNDDLYGRRYAHSLYLEVAAETGIAGLAIFATILAAGFWKARGTIRLFRQKGDDGSALLVLSLALGLTGYLTSSLFLHGDYIRYLWLLLGLIAAAHRIAREAKIATPQEAGS